MVLPNARLEIVAPESITLESGRAIARIRLFLRQGGGRSPIPSTARQSWSRVGAVQEPLPQNLRNPAAIPSITFTAPGSYTYQVTVSDGNWRDTQPFTIRVLPAASGVATTQRYRIEAPTQVTLPNSAIVQILPLRPNAQSPASLQQSWRQLAGPGEATLRNLRNPEAPPTIEFPQAGTYRFEVSIALPQGLETYSFSIEVLPAVPVNQPPVIHLAGGDRTVNLPNVAWLQAEVSDDGLPSTPGRLTYRWQQISPAAPAVVFSNPNLAATPAFFPGKGRYELRLSASDGAASNTATLWVVVNQAPMVEAIAPQWVVMPNTATLTGRVLDDGLGDPAAGRITVQWAQVSGPGNVTFMPQGGDGAIATASFSAEGLYQLRFVAHNGFVTGYQEISVRVNLTPVVVNVGGDRTATLGEPITLTGSLSTEISPAALTVQWEQVSGPAPTYFTTPQALTTDANFPAVGLYTLRLVVQGATSEPIASTVQVAVNAAPVIQIDAPPLVTLPAATTLTGIIVNDGRGNPQIGTVVSSWQQISGPATAIIQGADTLTPTVIFPTSGKYLLELAVDNGIQVARSRVLVVANQAPVVKAGADQTLPEPGRISLTGDVQDDSLPDAPNSLRVEWTMVSGPGSVTFANPSSPCTDARFTVAGTYQLRLTADDGGAIASDEVTITVGMERTSITEGRVALYTFEEGEGRVVRDRAGVGEPMDLYLAQCDAKDVIWQPTRGLAIEGQVDLSTRGPATKLFEAVQRTHQLTVEVWFKPVSDRPLRGRGIPIRILSIAACGKAAHDNRNFTLQQGQQGQNQASFYHARLRTKAPATSDEDGVKTLPGSIDPSLPLNHIVYTWNGTGNARLYVDGALLQSETFLAPRSGWDNSLASWDSSYELAIANDPQGEWSGRGKFYQIAFYNRALTPDEVTHNYHIGIDMLNQ